MMGRMGVMKRKQNENPAQRKAEAAAALENAYEACTIDGAVTVYAIAQYMDLKPRTVKERLKKDGRFWIDGEQVGRKEPGSSG